MKKLIVLTLAVAAAVVANASQMDWKFSTSADYKNYNVYIVSAITEGGFTKLSDITDNLLGTAGNTGTVTGSRTYLAQGRVTGLTAAEKSDVNFYYVIVNPNDATGYWTMASSGQAYETATDAAGSAIPAATANGLLATAKTAWATGGGGQEGGDGPEPTSGILLLVGAGVLGLRRKQK